MGKVVMNRRTFLGALGIGAVGAGSVAMMSGCSPSLDTEASSGGSVDGGASLTLDDVDVSEEVSADVVVVGSGAAGLSAAVEAAEKGAFVVLVEKASQFGGSTQFAEGIFAAGSSLQKQLGIEGDPAFLLEQEYEFQNYKVDPKLWEQVVANSAGNIDWLMERGCVIVDVAATGGEYATWHVYDSEKHGATLVDALVATAQNAGADMRTKCAAASVLRDGSGVVAGLLAEKDDGTYLHVKAPAVVLATGGFAANREMVEDRALVDYDRVHFRGVPEVEGDGIRMASALGSAKSRTITLCLLGSAVTSVSHASPVTLAGAMEPMELWVNQDIERFINEEIVTHYTRASNAVLMQETVYSFVDSAVLDKLAVEGTRYGAGAYIMAGTKLATIVEDIDSAIANGADDIFKADTLEGLADKMGIDAQKLAGVVDEYNGFCEVGVDESYGKDASNLVPVSQPPFYGFKLGVNMMNTMGGVRTDVQCRVLDSDGNPIEGLFAAGMECDGYAGETYGMVLPGSDQGIAVCTGRVAGARAAELSRG